VVGIFLKCNLADFCFVLLLITVCFKTQDESGVCGAELCAVRSVKAQLRPSFAAIATIAAILEPQEKAEEISKKKRAILRQPPTDSFYRVVVPVAVVAVTAAAAVWWWLRRKEN
jgi:hypothetical protein